MSIYFSNCPSKSDHILAPINMPSLQHKSIYYSLTLSSAPLFCSAVWLYHMLALTFLWLPVVYQRQRVHGYPHSFSTCTICPVPQYSSCQVALRLLVKSPSSNLQGLNMTVDFWKRINPKHLQSGVIFLFKTVKKTTQNNSISYTETGFHLIYLFMMEVISVLLWQLLVMAH